MPNERISFRTLVLSDDTLLVLKCRVGVIDYRNAVKRMSFFKYAFGNKLNVQDSNLTTFRSSFINLFGI